MAWTAPFTAVASTVLTAAQLNTNLRDNLNQTGPALVSAAGQILVATAANAMAARTPATANVEPAETTTSTSFTALATAGPAVTVTTGTKAFVGLYASVSSSIGFASLMGWAVSGASSLPADTSYAIGPWGGSVGGLIFRFGATFLQTGLTAGSNTFTAQYYSGSASNTATFEHRKMWVIPL